MDVGTLIVPDAQATELIQPGKRPLHDPAPAAQATTMRRAPHGHQRTDATSSKAVADRLRIVTTITQYTDRSASRPPAVALQRQYRVNQGQGLLRVVPVGASQAHGERDALAIADQMPLAAALGAVRRIRTSLGPPKTALTELPSTTARDQSMRP